MSKYVVNFVLGSQRFSMRGELNELSNFRGLSPVDVHILCVVYRLL